VADPEPRSDDELRRCIREGDPPEGDAVCAIAERHVGDDEGEHAMYLALQLGMGDPTWWAGRFVGASTLEELAMAFVVEQQSLTVTE
jgi:hypothetical protein